MDNNPNEAEDAERAELRRQIEAALHIDWAFKDVHGRPDKIIVDGTPKGAYHTSYKLFVDNMLELFEAQHQEWLKEQLAKVPEDKITEVFDQSDEEFDNHCGFNEACAAWRAALRKETK